MDEEPKHEKEPEEEQLSGWGRGGATGEGRVKEVCLLVEKEKPLLKVLFVYKCIQHFLVDFLKRFGSIFGGFQKIDVISDKE